MTVTEITASNGEVTLAGSLWEPDTDAAALLLMHPGSGPADRDNDVLFPPIRRALLADGIAVCSFDKRGVGGSGGSWLTADIPTQAGDLAVALSAVRARCGDLPTGLFGHSQGGWVVLEAAGRVGCDFVVTNSGPGVTPRRQEQFSTASRVAHLPAERSAAAQRLFDSLMELMGRRASFAAAQALIGEPGNAEPLADLLAAGAFVPTDEQLWSFGTTISEYDPAPALRGLRVPLLGLFGGADTVVPVAASVQVFTAAVPADLLTVQVVPGADHRMQTPDGSFADGYLPALTGFVRSVAGTSPRQVCRSPAHGRPAQD